MARVLYIAWQIVWGLPQTLLGALVYAFVRPKRHGVFKGAVVSAWPKDSSVSLGLFIFVAQRAVRPGEDPGNPRSDALRRLVAHEYGHTVQSLFLGPLYLVVIGIPSAIWANVPALRARRVRAATSYYRFYTERNANWLSERLLGLDVPRR